MAAAACYPRGERRRQSHGDFIGSEEHLRGDADQSAAALDAARALGGLAPRAWPRPRGGRLPAARRSVRVVAGAGAARPDAPLRDRVRAPGGARAARRHVPGRGGAAPLGLAGCRTAGGAVRPRTTARGGAARGHPRGIPGFRRVDRGGRPRRGDHRDARVVDTGSARRAAQRVGRRRSSRSRRARSRRADIACRPRSTTAASGTGASTASITSNGGSRRSASGATRPPRGGSPVTDSWRARRPRGATAGRSPSTGAPAVPTPTWCSTARSPSPTPTVCRSTSASCCRW